MSRWNRVGQLYSRLFQESNEEGVEEAWLAQQHKICRDELSWSSQM